MKHLAIILLTLLPLGAMAQKSDTVVIHNIDKIDIESNNNGNWLKVNVYGRDLDEDFNYEYRALQEEPKDTEWDVDFVKNDSKKLFRRNGLNRDKHKSWFCGGLHFGYVMCGDRKELRHGWEFGISKLVGLNYAPWKNGPQIMTGLGFSAQEFRGQYGYYFNKERKHLLSTPTTEEMSSTKTSLSIVSFQLPIDIYKPIYKDFAVGVGAILNWNVAVVAENEYSIGDKDYEEEIRGLNYRPFTVDLRAFLKFGDTELYVKHSPMTMFCKGDGPQCYRTSIGISLDF